MPKLIFIYLFFFYLANPLGAQDTLSQTIFDHEVIIFDKIQKIPRKISRLDERATLLKKMVQVDDVSLYVLEEGSGIPLVLIHGGPGSSSHYFHQSFSNAAKFARVIYYDQRANGLSEYNEGTGFTVDQAVNDLENLRKALNIGKWIILGHSYGGLLAQYYTIKYPDKVAGIVLVSSSIRMNIDQGSSDSQIYFTEIEKERVNKIFNSSDMSSSEKVYNALLNGDWKRQNYYKPSKIRMAQIALYESPIGKFNGIMVQSLSDLDFTGYFINSPIPSLIIEGQWDPGVGPKKAESLLLQFPNSDIHIFENSSHQPFSEESDKFFNLLESFVSELPLINKNKFSIWKKEIEKLEAPKEAQKMREKPFISLLEEKKFESAEKYLKNDSTNDPSTMLFREKAVSTLAFRFLAEEDYNSAIKVLKFNTDAFPWSYYNYFLIGHTYQKWNKPRKAIEFYRKALRLNNDSIGIKNRIDSLIQKNK